jgi:phytoene dehydrogenase-like protein
MNEEKSIIIIGAGFAGLSTGIYAQLNGYKTRIFEMHNQPGGLCTSWKRKGYTFDGCIHWLVGSSPDSGTHDLWEETGIAEGREFVYMDEYFRFEDAAGRTLIFYTDVDRLEEHLLDFSPQDKNVITDFTKSIRACLNFDIPSKNDPFLVRIKKQIRSTYIFIANGKKMKEWMNTTAEDFTKKIKDPTLAEALRKAWVPEFSMMFMIFTFAYLHNKNAGYPIGGSMPMSKALESKYKSLGGEITYNSRISRILTSNGAATGVRLENGEEYQADRVISAADGHSTLYDMLENKFGDEKSRKPYEKWPIFPSLIFASFGVKRKFDDMPRTVSGITFKLKDPVMIADRLHDNLSVHIFNQDPTLAPEGKTAITVMLESDYDYWKNLAKDRKIYDQKKEETGKIIIELLEQRFHGISPLIEVTDIATPLTYERYTGNWKGTFEGWLITPDNADVMMHPMSQTIAGLKNFYMCGQWVEPGGGLPTAVMSAKRLMKKICREDGIRFKC